MFYAFLAWLLGFVKPGRYGTRLFNALARLTVTVALETVCFRRNGLDIEVFLVTRSMKDSAYPGGKHVPGSAMRCGEQESDVFRRLSDREYGARITKATFVCNFNHTEEARGHFFTPIYLVELEGEPTGGHWYPVNNMPAETIEHHRDIVIRWALVAYRDSHK